MLQTIIAVGVLIYLLFIAGEFLGGKVNIVHGLIFLLSVSLLFKPTIEKTMIIILSLIMIILLAIKIKIAKSK